MTNPPEINNWPAGGVLTLDTCIDLALANNPATRSAWASARAAAAQRGVVSSANLPEISMDLGIRSGSDLIGKHGQENPAITFSGGFSVRYLIFDGNRVDSEIASAEAAFRAADWAFKGTLLEVALAAEVAWFELQGALWYQSAVEELIRQAQYHVDLAQARYEVGLARKYDVAQARATLAQAQLHRAAASSRVLRSQGALASALGLPPSTALSVQPLAEDFDLIPLKDVDALMGQALATRPELQQAQALVEKAIADVEVANAGQWPSVTADASLSSAYDSRTGESIPWSVGVGVSIPIFAGFDSSYQIERAKALEQQARANLSGTVSDVQFDVWVAHADAIEARDTVTALTLVVDASSESLLLAEENYKNGVGTMAEVIDAQAALASARIGLVEARLSWLKSFARLERAVGQAVSRTPNSSPVSAGVR